MFPKISCIIPVYNAEKYLRRCLDTVCSQIYPNVEIILIDDGSFDNSGNICDTYADKYHNIKVSHISNGGASLARKIGLDMSTSEYVTFMDSDDYISKDYISTLYENMIKYEVSISACNVKRVKEGDEGVNIVNRFDEQLLSFDKIMSRFFKYEFWGLCGKLYHKTIFNDIYFPKATLSEDYVIMMQLFTKERAMAYTDSPLYCYEYHENSLSHQKLSKRAFEEFENTLYVYELVKEQAPQYSQLALMNVVETSVKLLLMGDVELRNGYKEQYTSIHQFLNEHISEIYHNHYLLRNVKIIAVMLRFCPYMDRVLNKILKK